MFKTLKKFFYFLIEKQFIYLDETKPDIILRDSYIFYPNHTFTRENRLKGIQFHKQIKVKPFCAYKKENIFLLGPYGIPIDRKGKIIIMFTKERTLILLRRTINMLGILNFVYYYLKIILSNHKEIDLNMGLYLIPAHGYYPGGPNFAHWLLDNLPQLYIKEFIDFQKIIINNKPLKWQLETLKLLDFPDSKLYKHYKNLSKVKTIFFTTLRTRVKNNDRDPITRKWLKNYLVRNTNITEEPGHRLFISRQNMTRGHIKNYEEFLNLLKNYKVDVYKPGEINLLNDIEIFANTSLLISMHGAGTMNMIFSKRNDMKVIEISYGEKWSNTRAYEIAKEMDYGFYSFKASSDNLKLRDGRFVECCKVNLEKFEEIIKEL